MTCRICKKALGKDDKMLCMTCVDFIIWKYGNLSEYEDNLIKNPWNKVEVKK